MSIRSVLTAVAAATLVGITVAPAAAEQGHLTDPAGDFPDIRRLDYNNAQAKVTMTMKFGSVADAQNQSFYLQWGAPKKYQVFVSSGLDPALRFFRDADSFRTVACDNLSVAINTTTDSTKVVIPRSCLPKAPDTLRFKGIATQGTSLSDQTSLSPKVDRG